MKDSFENFPVFLDAEVDTGCFLSEDFKSLADKVEDDDNRAIRKIRVRFSIKKDYFKMPRSFYMQYGNVSYVRNTLLAREILIDYRS